VDTTVLVKTQPGSHSCVLAPHLKQELSSGAVGKYGQMFPDLPSPQADEEALLALGRSGAAMDIALGPNADGPRTDNPRIAAGWPLFGQFIAHDITADRSLLQHHANVRELRNFRTPALDLESLYAAGPTGTPYLYDMNDADMFLLGINDAGLPNDLQRNAQGRALIGDPRDDVHLIASQLHVAFLKFHNAVVRHLRAEGVPGDQVFAEAQRVVRWHYQWIAVHQFLPLIAGGALVAEVRRDGPRFYSYEDRPFIPVEFADGAYRFGHSQIRSLYQLNAHASGCIFPDCSGMRPVPQEHVLDWRYFFEIDTEVAPQASKKIDTHLTHALIALPESVVGVTPMPEYASLAVRDLLRAHAIDLPSGEAIARAMGVAPLTEDEVGLTAHGWRGETPLWYYVLREAEVQHNGEWLGDVGGRIVTEVLVGLIDGDPSSYRNAEQEWRPSLPAATPGDYTITDLLRLAGVA
jgi:Animal haem peroxidase